MKKLGFTLVELLSVIVILGVLAFLITPIIFNTVSNFNTDSYQSQIETIESGAISYASDNKLTSAVNRFYVTVGQLKQYGYIRKDLVNPDKEMNEGSEKQEWFNNDSLIEIVKTDTGYTASYLEYSSNSKEELNSDLTKEDISIEYEADFVTNTTSSFDDDVVIKAFDDDNTNISSSITKTYYTNGEKVSSIGSLVIDRVYTVVYTVTSNGVTQSVARNISLKLDISDFTDRLLSSSATYTYDGGTYLKGDITNNYAWFSGHLWRIMGVTEEGNIRLIMEDPISTISRGTEQFSTSYQYNWLNDEFYNSFDDKDYLLSEEYCSGDIAVTFTSSRTECVGKTISKVTLLSTDEYNLAGGNSSYYNNGIFALKDNSYISGSYNIIFTNGVSNSSLAYPMRPVITIDPNILVSYGTGTLEYPYGMNFIREDKNGNLNTISKNGEYVNFDGNLYRIIEHNDIGTKLIMNDKYQAVSNSQIFSSSFITDSEKEKIINTTWYKGDNLSKESNYELFLYSKSNPVESYVGAPKIGELFTVYDPNDANYVWTINHGLSNPIATSDNGYMYEMTGNWYSKPVIIVKPEIKITSGNGMKNNPYQI